MALQLKKDADGKLRGFWYGLYFRADGRRTVVNLGVKVEGKPPASGRVGDLGDNPFEASRRRALAALEALRGEEKKGAHDEGRGIAAVQGTNRGSVERGGDGLDRESHRVRGRIHRTRKSEGKMGGGFHGMGKKQWGQVRAGCHGFHCGGLPGLVLQPQKSETFGADRPKHQVRACAGV